jgi:hypothetical protein
MGSLGLIDVAVALLALVFITAIAWAARERGRIHRSSAFTSETADDVESLIDRVHQPRERRAGRRTIRSGSGIHLTAYLIAALV